MITMIMPLVVEVKLACITELNACDVRSHMSSLSVTPPYFANDLFYLFIICLKTVNFSSEEHSA